MLAAYTMRRLPSARSSLFLGRERLPCWTTERPIGLERKVSSGEAPRCPRRVAGAGEHSQMQAQVRQQLARDAPEWQGQTR